MLTKESLLKFCGTAINKDSGEKKPCVVLLGPVYCVYPNGADAVQLLDPLYLCRIRAPEILSISPDAGGVSVEHSFSEALEFVRLSLAEYDVFNMSGNPISFTFDDFVELT